MDPLTLLFLLLTCVPALLFDPSPSSRPSSSHPSLLLCFKILLCFHVPLYLRSLFLCFPAGLVHPTPVISPSDEPVTSCSSVLCSGVSCRASYAVPPSWQRPRSVNPSCTSGAERTRSLSVSHAQPHRDSFKLLGVTFDCKLRMDMTVRDVVSQASWKLTTILRARRFHDVPQLTHMYKSKVLSFVEYHTPAVYHAAKNHTGRNRRSSDALSPRMRSL